MSRNIIIYGLALAGLLILLKWLEWRFIIIDHTIEVYSGALALVFTGLGIWLAVKLARPKVRTVVVMQPAPEAPGKDIDEKELARLGLSGREQEVLQLMAEQGRITRALAARAGRAGIPSRAYIMLSNHSLFSKTSRVSFQMASRTSRGSSPETARTATPAAIRRFSPATLTM